MYRFTKRLFDILASGLALVLLSPIWVITVIGIEINDFGPVFFTARRIGKDNKEFKMFKFRSMRVKEGQHVQTLRPEKDRIFAFGKLIRKFKIDELPQLLNVFIGDMSIIGPRPVAPSQFDIFRAGKYDETKKVRPGLSGPAALYDYIYGDRFEESNIELYKEKVIPIRRELELVYISKQGFLFDIKMVVWTVHCIVACMFGKTPQKIYDYLVALSNESAKDTEGGISRS